MIYGYLAIGCCVALILLTILACNDIVDYDTPWSMILSIGCEVFVFLYFATLPCA